jgi:RHS repeat-associated protein
MLTAALWLSESVINDPLPGNQSTGSARQSTALLTDGSGIVAYGGAGDGNRSGIFVRTVDDQGSPTGAPIGVNQTTSGTRGGAVVATFDDGGSLVAWYGRGRGDRFGIFARRISSGGQFGSDEIKINQTTFGIQAYPVIATLPGGGFVVAWAGTGRRDIAGVFFRRFDDAGHPLGDETRVNSRSAGIQGSPQLVATGDGFAVAYAGKSEGDAAGVFVRRYDHDGRPVSAETRVNQTRGGIQGSPDIAAVGDDQLLLVWSGRGDGDPSGIFVRTIDSQGTFSGDEIRVNETTSGFQFGPSVATADDGSFLVLWNEFAARRFDTEVKGRHFQSITSPASDEFTLPLKSSGQQYTPSVAGDGQGGYLASWTRQRHGNKDVYARRLPPQQMADVDPPVVSLRLKHDTGNSDSDRLTSNIAIAGSVADASAIASISLDVTGLQSSRIDLTDFYDPATGTLVVSDAALRGLLVDPIVDGLIQLALSATDVVGNVSSPVPLTFTLDTTPPKLSHAQLARESDSDVIGDNRTHTSMVDVTGNAEPGSAIRWLDSGQQATVDLHGSFRLSSLALAPGEVTYDLLVQDGAGNSSLRTITLFFEAGINLSESTFVSEAVVSLPLPPTAVSPTLRFDVTATFDTAAFGFAGEDVLGISVVDAADPSRVLLTRADGNESLLSISGGEVDFDPGLVRFDGRSAEIDLSALAEYDQIGLAARWINSDTDLGSTVQLHRIAIDEDNDAQTNPTFAVNTTGIDAGPAIALDEYSVDPSLTGLLGDVWIEAATGLYRATLQVMTGDLATGRRLAVALPGLPSGIDVLTASGVDSSGAAYINVAPAVRSGGLDAHSRSAEVNLTISNPLALPLNLRPIVYSAGVNTAPVVNDPGPLSVIAGGYLEADFSAVDADGDLVRYAIRSEGGLPIAKLTATGLMTITPAPGQEGSYSFDLVVSDGVGETVLPVSLTIVSDTRTTTRLSGVVLSTESEPLSGIPIELGNDSTTTAADGRFELTVSLGSTADALLVRGEAHTGVAVYPFIAEKIPLLLGRDLYQGSANVIGRPIYLPALDVAGGQAIDPDSNTTVTTAAIPGAAVFIEAGSLKDQLGQPFRGVLSITEVPADLTPAALPEGLFTDLVVTIQPGEMVFETPAPLTLPNRAGHAPATEMILWSINPITGQFDQVGMGRVSDDGSLIETISGGIRNSSWHDFSTTRPAGTPPDDNDNNPDKDCDDCENRHQPQDPPRNAERINVHSGDSLAASDQPSPGPWAPDSRSGSGISSFTLTPGGSNGFSSWSAGGAAMADGTVRNELFGVSTASGDYLGSTLFRSSTIDGGESSSVLFLPGRTARGSGEPESPLARSRDHAESSVSTHAGALHKSHTLVSYSSLGTGRSLTLVYDSERADPRPLVHTEVQDPGRNIDSPVLVSGLTVFGGAARSPLRNAGDVQGATGGLALPAIETAPQYRSIAAGTNAAGTIHQIDELAGYPSGRYGYTSSLRISGAGNLNTSGLTTELQSQLVHINTVTSPLGSGWGIAGHQQLVVNYDGSILLIDGDGGESVFERAEGTDYFTAPGDFSRLYKDADGTYRRVLIDHTVHHFNPDRQLRSIVDRNGNSTDFEYEGEGRLRKIIDPVGLATTFEYSGGVLRAIVDPANRRTQFRHDSTGNLIQIVDPDLTSRQFDYDRNHRLTGETNKNGESEQIEYDAAGRINRFTRTDGSTIRYSAAQSQAFAPPELTSNANTAPPAVSLGRQAIAAVADANGNVTTTRLDRAGQTIESIDGAGVLPSFVRSGDNRVTELTDGRGNRTFMTYDDRGNVTSISDPVARGGVNTSLFRNRVYLTGADSSQVVVHDVDDDTLVDVLVAAAGSDAVFLRRGRGDGTLGDPTPIAVNDVRSLALADVDGDGTDDLITASSDGVASVMLGEGDGRFAAPLTHTLTHAAHLIKAADINGDEQLDLIVLSQSAGTIDVLLGGGDGTFTTAVTYGVAANAVSFDIGDIDGDGDLDVVTASRSLANHVSLLRGLGDGSFSSRVDMTIAAAELLALRLADADRDGALDLIASDGVSAVWFAAGRGDGTFDSASMHDFAFPAFAAPAQPPTTILEIADLGGDGNLDLLVAQPSAGGFATFIGDGNGDFSPSESVYIGGDVRSLAVSDLNADSYLDVVGLDPLGRFVSVRIGSRAGTFNPETEGGGIGVLLESPPDAIKAADLNNDGRLDLVAFSRRDNSISILRNDGIGSLETPAMLFLDATPRDVALRDVDGDGNLDFVAPLDSTDQLQVVFGDGTTSGDGATITLGTIDQPNVADVADLNSDGIPDLIVAGSSGFHVQLGQGDRVFTPLSSLDLPSPASQVVAGDFNEDGNVDLALAVASPSETLVVIQLGRGDGTFDAPSNFAVGGSGPFPKPLSDLKWLDVNGDGAGDFVASDPSSNSIRVLLGVGDGTFATAVETTVADDPVGLSVVDLNGDAVLDVAVASAGDGVASVLLGVGDGRFVDRQDYYLASNPVGLAVIDVSDSGAPNLYSVGLGSVFLVTVRSAVDSAIGLGDAQRFEYDPQFSQLTRRVDELGHQILIEIDASNGNAISIARVMGDVGGGDDVVTSYTYTPHGLVDTMTDPLGRVTDYQYDAYGRLIATTLALGTSDEATRWMEYDAAGNMTALVDALGHRTQYEFDVLNRLVSTTDADPDGAGLLEAPTRSYSYDDHGNVTHITDALSGTMSYQYDAQHRLVRKIDSIGNAWNYRYDEAGNLSQFTDRLGRVTTYVYDDRNRISKIVDPERAAERRAHDADGNLVRRFDKNGNVWLAEYDPRNRTTRQVDPLGHETKIIYDRANNVVETVDPLSRRTRFQFDDLDRLVALIEPDPDTSAGPLTSPIYTFEYDQASNPTGRIDPLGNAVLTEYDNRNRAVTETLPDPDGPLGPLIAPVYQFSYDDAGRLIRVLDPISRVTSYTYDDLNRLVMTELPDPDGPLGEGVPTIVNSYDIASNLIARIDPLGNSTTFDYDTLYRLVARTDPDPDGGGPLLSPVTTMTYDAESQLTSISDPLLRTMTFEHDRLGRVTREIYPDPDGSGPDTSPLISHTYDAVGNRLSTVDPLGNVTRFEYDDDNRPVRTIMPDPDGPTGPQPGPIHTLAYDAADQVLRMIDALGRTTSRQYDDLGRVTAETYPDPDGAGPLAAPVMTFVFDAIGNESSMTDALGNTTDYLYDNLYRRTGVVVPDPDGSAGPQGRPTTHIDYDVVNRPLRVVDPLGRTSEFIHDDLDRIVREIYPDPDAGGPLTSPETTYTFDLIGNQLSTTDAVGSATSYEYDNLYRRTKIVQADPDGAGPLAAPATTYTYDIASQRLTATDPLGRTVTQDYDRLGRMIRVTDPDPDGSGPLPPAITTYQFDRVGNQLASTDPLGHVIRYEYDHLYRRTAQVSEDLDGASGPLENPTTTYTYDPVGNLLTLIDPSGNATRWQYDGLDRNISETITLDGADVLRGHQYDAMSNLIRSKDRNGRITEYDYDTIHRRVAQRWLDEQQNPIRTITSQFDEADQLLAVEDPTSGSRYDYDYDALGRVTSTRVRNGGVELSLDNVYDAQSRRTSQSATVGGVPDYRNEYQYDNLHRLTQLQQHEQAGGNAVSAKRFDYGYNAASQLVLSQRYADLDAVSLITSSSSQYDGQGRLVGLGHSNTAEPIAGYDFSYDVASRLTGIDSHTDGFSDFDYDPVDQLIHATHPAQPEETYQYDENGNRTSHGHQTGDHNRLRFDGQFDYLYDAEGNRVLRVDTITDAATEYGWDHRNRLVSITDRESLTGLATGRTEHRYDAFDRWISTSNDPDGDGPIVETIRRFEYDGSNIVLERSEAGEVTGRYSWGVLVDQIMAEEDATSGAVLYPLADHLGTVRDVIDASGAVVNHIRYDSYGIIASETDSAIETLFGYTGKPLDDSTGLQNNHHRWYDAAIGNWTSEDPIGFAAGDTNLNRYAGNRPTTATDPDGLVLFAFDGTGNSETQQDQGVTTKTNVLIFYQQYKGDKFYQQGVGVGPVDYFGAGTGRGAKRKVKTAVAATKSYFEENPNREKVIDVVGFSRGAAEAVDYLNQIEPYAKENNVRLRFAGLFDTVFAMGIPNAINIGFDTTVPPGVPTYHAMSLNETRSAFDVARQRTDENFPDVFEVWFAGVHSNVGGGYYDRGLSDIALQWMMARAIEEGVPVTHDPNCRPDPNGDMVDSLAEFVDRMSLFGIPLGGLFDAQTFRSIESFDHIHESVFQRTNGTPKNHPFPRNLRSNTFTVR